MRSKLLLSTQHRGSLQQPCSLSTRGRVVDAAVRTTQKPEWTCRRRKRPSSLDYLEDGFPRLHVCEHLNIVGDLGKCGRVVIGVDDQDVDSHRAALLDTVRCHHLEAGKNRCYTHEGRCVPKGRSLLFVHSSSHSLNVEGQE